MIEDPEGSDWVRPSSYRNATPPSGPDDGPRRSAAGEPRGRAGGGGSRRGTPPPDVPPEPRFEPRPGSRAARRAEAEQAAANAKGRSGRSRRGAAPEPAREPRPGASRSKRGASRGSGGSRGSGASATSRTPAPAAALPEAPSLYELPTEPVPAVELGGDGSGNGTGRPPRSQNAKVMIVLGALLAPLLLIALIVIIPNLVSSGGSAKAKTAPTVAGAQYKLFLRPGLTLSQIGEVVGTLPGHTKAGFLAVANNGKIRSKYEAVSSNSLEGLLAPDTYFVGPTETDDSIVRRLVTHFDAIADQTGVGSATTVSPYQTIIIASLVGQESKLPADSPLVAAVIYNRIKAKMPLQIDATLCFAKGGCPPVPTNADKKLDNPYNTYKIAGLPPTPIATVTVSALRAALAPPAVPYLYYVIGDNTGKLVFATTLQQQNVNISAARKKGLL